MAKLTRDEFISSLKEMNLLEIKELVDAMKEEFGVDPSAVAVAAAPAAGAATAAADTPYFSSIPLTNSASSATDKASMLSNNSSIFAILNFLLIYFLFSELFVLIFTAM